jgi:3-methyladenine DNA glycosylase AlkD
VKNQKVKQIVEQLKSHSNPKAVEGMARYGIVSKKVLGVSLPTLRRMAKEIGEDHALAMELWLTKIYDARLIAMMIEDPRSISEKQVDEWVKDFDNWAICDGCCVHLFRKTPFAWKKAKTWVRRKEEFAKRAGFVMMATLAVHDKITEDKKFISLFPSIKLAANDERNGVKKGVNWALRQIGKRNLALNKQAILLAGELKNMNSAGARWIAADAIRELKSDAVQKRLKRKRDE